MDDSTKLEYNKRYQSMMESDLGMTTKDFVNFDVVNFENDSLYHVEIRSKNKVRCDCPDYYRRGFVPCKHILFALFNMDDYKTRNEKIYNDLMSRFKNNLSEVKI